MCLSRDSVHVCIGVIPLHMTGPCGHRLTPPFTNIPSELVRQPGAPWIVIRSGKKRRRCRKRKQKHGRRSGLLLRLRNNPHKPPLPSLYRTNARSITHKTDDLELQLVGNCYIRECCVLIITETWLNPRSPNASVQLAGCSLHRWDGTEDSGKSRGGRLCIYVHEDWRLGQQDLRDSLLP